jgi:hypothetical protein
MDKVLFCITPILLMCNTHKIIKNKNKDKPTIMIDSGGWYISYYMGFFHYIFTTYGIDYFTYVYFTGVSAGGQTCGYCLATIHGCMDMKYWLDNGPKQAILSNNYGIGRLGLGCYNAGKFFYNQLNITQRNAITKYYSALCMDCMLQPYVCDNIDNTVDFGCAVAATGNVPIIMSAFPWKFRDVYLWDGYLNTYINNIIYIDTENILLFTFTPKGTHKNVMDLSKLITINGMDALIPSLYTQNEAIKRADALFQIGYEHAKNNENEILHKLNEIGIKISGDVH